MLGHVVAGKEPHRPRDAAAPHDGTHDGTHDGRSPSEQSERSEQSGQTQDPTRVVGSSGAPGPMGVSGTPGHDRRLGVGGGGSNVHARFVAVARVTDQSMLSSLR